MMQLPEELANSMRNSEVGVALQTPQIAARRLGSVPPHWLHVDVSSGEAASLRAIPGGGTQLWESISVLKDGEGQAPQYPLTPSSPANNETYIILNYLFFL